MKETAAIPVLTQYTKILVRSLGYASECSHFLKSLPNKIFVILSLFLLIKLSSTETPA